MSGKEGLSRWKRYPKYKDSGVEWLGEIPFNWKAGKVSYFCKVLTGGTPDRNNLDFWDSGTIPWISSGEVNKKIIRDTNEKITKLGMENSNAKILPLHSVMIALNGQGKTKGTSALLEIPATCNQSLAAMVCNPAILIPKFLYYYLESRYIEIRGLVGDDLRDGLNLSHVRSIPLPILSLPEQTTIASFLDHETARIDALIEKKQRQIDLLQEKRAALISQAVTKGLDPTVPMKDSGVPWLGEVPEDWKIIKLKFCVDIFGPGIQMGPFGSMLTNIESQFTGYKLYGQENIIKNDFSLGARWITSDTFNDLKKYELIEGDIVVTRKGSLGQCKIVPKLEIPGIIDSDTIRIRPDKNAIIPLFLEKLLHESYYIQEQIHIAQRGAIISGLNTSTIENIILVIPPVIEQLEILQYYLKEVEKNNLIIDKIQNSINYLQEYRSALISAAVTGKIDVRDTLSSPSEALS